MKKAVYAGSFDPITNGHLWMAKEGARMFNKLVVSIGVNPDKKCTFSLEERLDMLKNTLKDFRNVKVGSFSNQFLAKYAASINAEYLLRGIRTEGDYQYERTMRHINSDMNPDIVTVYLMPPREIVEVSSSMVKSMIGPEGWEEAIKSYVPEYVYGKLLEKFKANPAQ
ncbi:MAG: pantetheine-phosphate adenylyltransferase [Candidatus Woesearchaeota archaeon]